MHYESSSHVHDSLDGLLCLCILMLLSNTREAPRLPFLLIVSEILFCSENSVVSMVMGDLSCSLFPQPLLEPQFAHHGLVSTKGDLIFDPDQPRRCIVVDCPALKALVWCLSAIH